MTLAPLALLLPISSFLLFWVLIAIHREALAMGRLSVRGAMVVAFIAFEAVVLAITEVLSLGHHLAAGPTAAAWLVVTAVTAAVFHQTGGTAWLARWVRDGGVGRARDATTSSGWVTGGIVVLVVIGLVLMATALLYLPNNADSLVYHLARVASWEQARSVAHFATHYTAEIELAPLHEFNMLHLHLLAGTDSLDGFAQLLAFVVCVIGAAEIARLLGASREVQVGAAVVAAVVPSAILEATSTQNNLFAAAIGVSAVVIVLGWKPLGRVAPLAIALGLTVGLAIVVKGTLGVMIAPLLALLVVRVALEEARQSSWLAVVRRATGAGIVVVLSAAVMAAPFLQRNHDLFGTLGGPVTDATMNQEMAIRPGTANVVRSVAVNFRIGNIGDGVESRLSRFALDRLETLDDWTGAPLNDPRFAIGEPSDPYAHGDFTRFARAEEYGANPWHVLLMGLVVGVFGVASLRGDRAARLLLGMGVALAIGFVLFSATARWSLFVTRYALPVLVVWAPLIALALARLHRAVLRLAVALLVVAATPLLLDNTARPLSNRPEVANDLEPYFAPQLEGTPYLRATPQDYVDLRDAIVATGCDRVAIGSFVLFEYPIWVGLKNAGWQGEIKHVGVTNQSRVLEDAAFEPCATIREAAPDGPLAPIDGQVDVDLGVLTLSIDEDLVDRLPPRSLSSSP